ncbi:MAG: DciA family protein, partial [Candidatus Binatia bacterium]
GESLPTERAPVDAQRLVVAVRTAAWLQELDLLRRELCSRLNAWMGRKVINELFLVVGRVDRGSANPKQTNDRALEQLWSALKKHEGDPPD